MRPMAVATRPRNCHPTPLVGDPDVPARLRRRLAVL